MSKISVIIPVYNAEKYLGQCLDSLIGQTFSDFEIICVNDGSNDSSLDILNSYADKCDKIKIINIENSGPGPARNKGLDIASGDYITFVDADDWVDKKFLEILYASAIKTNADITECSLCSYYEAASIYKNRDDIRKLKKYIKTADFTRVPRDKVISNLFNLGFKTAWKKLYKRELFYHLRFKNYLFAEDVLVVLEAYLKSKVFSYLPDILYYYRLRNASVSHDVSETAMQIFPVYKDIVDIIKKYGVYDILFSQFQNSFLPLFCKTYLRVPDNLKENYINNVHNLLNDKSYDKFLKHISGEIDIELNFLKRIFSVANHYTADGTKYRKKVIIFGRQFIL